MIDELKHYERFLVHLKRRNFQVWNFETFLRANKRALPERLVVLRHDIHHRDIVGGYKMLQLEEEICGVTSTCYVQWRFRPLLKAERAYETRDDWQRNYENFIVHCKDRKVDVQPHVSPFSMYFAEESPLFTPESGEKFDANLSRHYHEFQLKGRRGEPLVRHLQVVGEDIFETKGLFRAVVEHLKTYRNEWESKFGSKVIGYSAHGESAVNKFYRYDSNRVLDNAVVKQSGAYQYTSNSIEILHYLRYLSDNSFATKDLKNFYKELDKRPHLPQRFQVLVHPAFWFREPGY